jgi:hypothetical protein
MTFFKSFSPAGGLQVSQNLAKILTALLCDNSAAMDDILFFRIWPKLEIVYSTALLCDNSVAMDDILFFSSAGAHCAQVAGLLVPLSQMSSYWS